MEREFWQQPVEIFFQSLQKVVLHIISQTQATPTTKGLTGLLTEVVMPISQIKRVSLISIIMTTEPEKRRSSPILRDISSVLNGLLTQRKFFGAKRETL